MRTLPSASSAAPPLTRIPRRLAAPIDATVVTGTAGLAAAGASAVFFRHPPRVPPNRAGVVVAPADGEVALVDVAVPPAELDLGTEPLPRVSIFLSVLDGTVVFVAIGFSTGYVSSLILKIVGMLRVPEAAEIAGLDTVKVPAQAYPEGIMASPPASQ